MLTDERINEIYEHLCNTIGFSYSSMSRATEAEVRKEQADQIAELTRQLAEARKDAERIEELEVLAARWTRLVNGLGDVLTGEGMDKTVDAATKAK